MEQDYSISNIFNNTTRKQKIGFGVIVIVIVVLLVALVVLTMSDSQNNAVDNKEEQTDGIVDVEENTYVDEEGYIVTQETTTYADGEKAIAETKMDEHGNVTTVDPNLITTYFPYQVMREHKDDDSTNRYYIEAYEEEKKIKAYIEYCDEDQDKNLVYEYINSIPLNLSDYTVEFVINETYTYCGE